VEIKKLKMKMDILVGKQSSESKESVLKKATVGKICGTGRFQAWSERVSDR